MAAITSLSFAALTNQSCDRKLSLPCTHFVPNFDACRFGLRVSTHSNANASRLVVRCMSSATGTMNFLVSSYILCDFSYLLIQCRFAIIWFQLFTASLKLCYSSIRLIEDLRLPVLLTTPSVQSLFNCTHFGTHFNKL